MMMEMLGAMAAQAAPAAGGAGGGMGLLIPMVLLFGLFYFMMIRPQQRKEKERLKMIAELRAGQRVVFGGGVIGTVAECREGTFLVDVAPKVTVEILRGAVSRVLPEGGDLPKDEK